MDKEFEYNKYQFLDAYEALLYMVDVLWKISKEPLFYLKMIK